MTLALNMSPTNPDPAQVQAADLYRAAQAAALLAYAPYSGFCVGAALLFDNGTIVTGCNVENMSYGLTICAERSALVRAVSEQGAQRRIVAIAVANTSNAASPPCGACRQMLSEFVTADAWVIFPADAIPANAVSKDALPGQTVLAFRALFPHVFAFDSQADKGHAL
jgi:cytidine deaminase